ncbi:MAG: TldD/PmbA family protein [Microthrixaceae bacterium]|nr:TldD/PmbA family protein [Microthrixaceae bacterium]
MAQRPGSAGPGPLRDREAALELADRVVGFARGAEQLEAVVVASEGTEIRAHRGTVEHNVSSSEAAVGVRVVDSGRTGVSWTDVLEDTALEQCVAEARDNSRFSSVDENAGVADSDGVVPTLLERSATGPTDPGVRAKVDLALQIDAGVFGADPRVVGHEGADYLDVSELFAVATTTGIRASSRSSITQAGTWALASDGDDTASGFGLSFGHRFHEVDPVEVVEEAVRRSTSMLGAVQVPSARMVVVLEPYVTSELLAAVAPMFSGESVLKGRSPYAGRVGEAVAAEGVSLRDDPLDAAAVGAVEVDAEGLATRTVDLISDGVLSGFMHNSYSARCLGTTSTASAVRAGHRGVPGVGPAVLTLAPGTDEPAAILASVDDGLLVTELSGLHSGLNTVSGDLSVGVEGRRIRNGELAEPVREVTIATTVQRLLADVIAIGCDHMRFPWESAGVTLAVAEVTVSGH